MSRRQRPSLASFWRDRRGVSAIEFALIAPVLILLYCGMAEMSQAMMAQRRLSNITSATGDLMAQSTQTGPLKSADIFKIADTIMAPFPTATLKICLASVVSDSTGKDTVAWQVTSKTGMTNCPAKDSEVKDIPVGVLPASQSVILAKASYVYTSTFGLVMPSNLTFNRTYYLRPRKTDAVLWNAAN
jgi:Flp pilus assembly protein TadG